MMQYYYDDIKLMPWIDFSRADFKKQDFYSKTLRIIMFVRLWHFITVYNCGVHIDLFLFGYSSTDGPSCWQIFSLPL